MSSIPQKNIKKSFELSKRVRIGELEEIEINESGDLYFKDEENRVLFDLAGLSDDEFGDFVVAINDIYEEYLATLEFFDPNSQDDNEHQRELERMQ